MIRNSRQAGVSRRLLRDLQAAATAAGDDRRASYDELAAEVTEELREYDAIRSGTFGGAFAVDGIGGLGDALIKARLARGWTQRQLGEKLGVTEQMVQRDEARSYENAGLARLAEVADALGFELAGALWRVTGEG